MSQYKPPHKVKDNIYKTIFGEPQLFLEFLENFISIDILKNLPPDSVEDISERFLPLFSDNKDSDTVKKINLNDDENLFVIGILEHESEINYTSSFKMLQYIVYVIADYVKENDKKYAEEINRYGVTKLKLSNSKEFKYPPVLPIVFFDGAGEWTSEKNFFDKTEKNAIFEKYVPKFEYELVNLNDYSQQDLVDFNNALSLLLVMDKVRRSTDIKGLRKLPEQYIEEMSKKVPEPFLVIFRDCVELLLRKINIPAEEIEKITERIYERRFNAMFDIIDGYDVQATRKQAKEEGIKETKKEYEAKEKEYEAKEKEYKSRIKKLEEELRRFKMSAEDRN